MFNILNESIYVFAKGVFRSKATKEERLARIKEGRIGNTYGPSSARKKNKTGGKSNSEKAHAKRMPTAARVQQIRRRARMAPKQRA